MPSKLMTPGQPKILLDWKHAEALIRVASWSYLCIAVTSAASMFRAETCDVEIAGYCCRNDTLYKPPGFDLSCFSGDDGNDVMLPSRQPLTAAATPAAPVFVEKREISSSTGSLAFRIRVESGSSLTIRCATAAPHVPSLLTNLKIQKVTNLLYVHCDVPQGNLTFARIFDGNPGPIIEMGLEDPRNIPKQTLQGDLFHGLSAGIHNFRLVQDRNNDNISLDLSDDFFQNFESLRVLDLRATSTRIPDSLKSLSRLTTLHLSGTQISEIASDAFSGLASLEELHISDAPIIGFGAKPFSDLETLTTLEMSSLHATRIPNDIFHGSTRLKSLKIREWPDLTTIGERVFGNASNLESLILGNFPLLETLPAVLFKKLPQVKNIEISDCGLKHLPTDLWPGCGGAPHELSVIKIVNSKIETLPEYFFRGCKKLRDLNLAQNHLKKIGKSLHEVISLRRLNLQGNRLASISVDDFKDLGELQYLILSENRIEFIEHGAFEKLHDLESLELNGNKLQHFDNLITAANEKTQRIILSNNKITNFPGFPFEDWPSFDTLEMDDNLVSTFDVPLLGSNDTSIHLRRNRIERIIFSKFDEIESLQQGDHQFHIDGNPFRCDGENFRFLRYIQEEMYADIAMFRNLSNCFCNGTSQLIGTVDLGELHTEVENCPEPCRCLAFPINASIIARCAHRNLDSMPVLPSGVTELDFEGNRLEAFPGALSAYKHLRIVNLKKNRLHSIDEMFSLAPPNLQFLSVESNRLERLNVDPKTVLRFSVALSDNPWICDCVSKNFKSFLDENALKISDYSAIECDEPIEVDGFDEFLLSRIPLDIMCTTNRPTVRLAVSSAVTAFSLTMLAAIIFCRNRILVFTFVYVHFNALFQFLSGESDTGEAKEFDAFLSYADLDREVAFEILNKLESTDSVFPKHFQVPFRLCFHERDFVAGQSISWNINNAVKSSYRTIVILSAGFLESSWSTVEFDTAYHQMLDDRGSRLIVILKGEIPKFEDLSDNVRAVLSTRTYLVWGERWFWKKLFYAMPHKKHTRMESERLKDKNRW